MLTTQDTCLMGCSISDFGTISFFQYTSLTRKPFNMLSIAIINGLISSVILETIILRI